MLDKDYEAHWLVLKPCKRDQVVTSEELLNK